MPIKQFVVDAFTDEIFSGNPAALCVLDEWLSDDLMMAITKENRYSETAFAVKNADYYNLRWFTPGGEIDLCGHATLGMAYVILNFYEPSQSVVQFDTKSGRLTVRRQGARYEMDFPAYDLHEVSVTDQMADAFGKQPDKAYLGRDLLCVFDKADDVHTLSPDLKKVKALDGLLQHVTAPGDNGSPFDCVSRSFGPKLAVDEDPVCGSGHCHIIPYWSKRLKKEILTAYQASERSGVLYCRMDGKTIHMAGNACLYAESILHIDE